MASNEKAEAREKFLEALKGYIDEKIRASENRDDVYYFGQIYEAEKELSDAIDKLLGGTNEHG